MFLFAWFLYLTEKNQYVAFFKFAIGMTLVAFYSLLGIIGFVVNTISENSDITHVLGVQLPLAVALYHSGL